jgi:hypothetical protein
MRLTAIPLLLLLLGVANAASAMTPQTVEATITFPYDTVLPGVPFDITVTVKNVSKSSVTVGTSARPLITLSNRQKLTIKDWQALEPRVSPNAPTWVELAPGESRQYFIDWHDFSPNMFHYPEFSGPGVYDVAFELAGNEPPENYVGSIITAPARLTRAVPPGEDEALWKKMIASNGGQWADDGLWNSPKGPAILREILQIHPASSYYPYALLLEPHLDRRRPATNDDIAKALDAAERFQLSPAYPHLLLRAGHVALGLAVDAAYRRDAAARVKYLDLAKRYYDDAAKRTNLPAVRVLAQRGRDRVQGTIDREKQRAVGTDGKVKQ